MVNALTASRRMKGVFFVKVVDIHGVERDIKAVSVEVSRQPEGIYYFCYGEYKGSGLFSDYERTILRFSQDVNEMLDYSEKLDSQLSVERASVIDNARRMGIVMS